MNKLLMILVIFSLMLTINVAFADESIDLNQTDIYVSNEGSDSLGNGTYENPYHTIDHSINMASNNSNIYLKSGTYNSTGYEITNKSISISGLGDVVLDARNDVSSQNIFKINNGSTLKVNNIRFVNGYADLDGTLSCIINQGQLYISNSTFDNFRTSIGIIKNENYLRLDNVATSNLGNTELFSAPYKYNMKIEFVYNVGNCEIFNSHISTSYNNRNMTITDSYIERFVSNKDYRNQTTRAYINNSFVYLLTVSDCDELIFNNTTINCDFTIFETTHIIEYSNMVFDNCYFNQNFKYKDYDESYGYSLKFDYSNVTVFSSYILTQLLFDHSNAIISYSCILTSISAMVLSNVNVNYNWWGDNKRPHASKAEYANLTANYWIVMMVENINDIEFRVNLTKYTNGLDVWNLDNPSKLYKRVAKFESETGYLVNSSGYLENGSFKARLVDNNPDTMVYATVDRQVLRIIVGNGNTNYTFYVSDSEGNDYFNDGSYDNPYKTFKKAVDSAFSGNTIYIFSGVYTLSWNANLKISKNLTFCGIGNAVLSRPNDRSIFIVDAKGILSLENLNFTTATSDYYNNEIIYLNGGGVSIKNCNFYNIRTKGIVYSDVSDYISINNSTFVNILGDSIVGNSSNITILNSKIMGKLDFIGSIVFASVTSNITIVNTLFDGLRNLYPLVLNPKYGLSDLRAYIYNSTFSNIYHEKYMGAPLITASTNQYHRGYCVIDGCVFENNTANLLFVDVINNSRFIGNTFTRYVDSEGRPSFSNTLPRSFVYSRLINNSYFYKNTFNTEYYEDMLVYASEIYYSSFIENVGGYGGAVSNAEEVHYCVFVNNSAAYGGDDIFVYSGNINCSGNWWGSNQKPSNDRVFVFIGTLTLDDWVIMTMDIENNVITASLNSLLDNNENIRSFDYILPSRDVTFTAQGGKLIPSSTCLIDNQAACELLKNTSDDFDVFGQIDNQITSLTVFNNSTQIIMNNLRIYGKDVLFNISLININGHRISNQDINVVILYKGSAIDSFVLTTDSKGNTRFNVDYSIGEYEVRASYLGNGYFEKSNSIATITVSSIKTSLYSRNYTYSGKNNKFYAILADLSGKYLLNQTLTLNIYDLNEKLLNTIEVKTGSGGRGDVLLSLDVGSYKMKWSFAGDEWYESSISESFITIKPIDTCITMLNTTFYGRGNDLEVVFKDIYGTLISGETITLTISNENESREFNIVANNGLASITINLIPGTYSLKASYKGDNIYGPSNATAILTVHPIIVTFNHNFYQVIPKNGVFTVILKDMYGTSVRGENVSLELVNKDLEKTYYAITDAYGEANFRIDATEGVYFAFINYGGNIWYDESVSAATIELSPNAIINPVYIKGEDLVQYYGENKYYFINFNDTNAYSLEGKTIHVMVSSSDWSKSFDLESNVFGEARIQITLEPGRYNITYNYKNEYYGLFAENSSEIIVYKMPTSLIASNMIMNHDEARNIEVKLLNKNGGAISNLPVKISVDGIDYNISTNQKGIAKLLLNLDLGLHNVYYSFENDNYLTSKGNCTVLVVDGSKTATNILGDDIAAREGEIINYTVLLSDLLDTPITSSEIILNITDMEGNLINSSKVYTDLKGIATFNFKLSYGNYLINAFYNGNEFNLASFNTNQINVKPLVKVTETILFGNDLEIVNGENTYYFVVLTTVGGEFIQNQTVEFVVKNNTYASITDENGRAYLKAMFAPGSYEVTVKYDGSNNLTKAAIRNYISVYGKVLNFYSRDIIKSYNNGTHYYVALYDANNEPLANKTIKFSIDGDVYQDITDEYGFACFEVWMDPGKYLINATYQGEYPDEYACVLNNITVLTTILGEDLDVYYNGSTIFTVTFLDFNDNVLSNVKVIFALDNVHYTINTDEFGIVALESNLNPGKHYITFINTITGQESSFIINIKSTLTTKDLVKYYNESSKFTATFKDESGNLLKNTDIRFTVGKDTYIVKTDVNGVASLSAEFNPGTYMISVLNTKTGEKSTNKITIKSTITTKNLVKYYKSSSKFTATFKDEYGKLLKNAKVKFTIGKKKYAAKTNSKGVASLSINFKPGKYIITTLNTKTGEKATNKITIKTIIISKDKSVKKGKKSNFKVKILNSKGKIAKKITVKFKIKGKTYKIKTNSKGIAKLNIKLNKGKYTVSTTFNGLTVKNKITVK